MTGTAGKITSLLRVGSKLIRGLFIVLPALWAPALFAQPLIHVTFGAEDVGKFPSGWVSRDGTKTAGVYTVQAEEGKRFLHADASNIGVQIGYEGRWSLKEYPTLQWQWRAVLFPSGTNEREKSGNDSCLGVYVVFRHWPLVKSIKYIWSDTAPAGASFNSPFSSSTKILVLRSGRALTGTWVTETRDMFSDYTHLFGDEKNPMADGIAVLTDSDNTHSHAIGDYADIQILSAAGAKPAQP